MYTEEFAREQQLGELQAAGQHGPLRPAPGPHPMAAGPQHSGAGVLRTPGPGAAQQQQPPRRGRMLGAATDSGTGTQASPPSPGCVAPPGSGRSLAPLPPHNSASRPLAATALVPALAVPGRLALPPLRPAAPAGDGSSAPPAAAHQSRATQGLPTPPAHAPPSAAAASSSGWATFEAADAPPWRPCHSTPAAPSAAGPNDGASLYDNPLVSCDDTVANLLGMSQTAPPVEVGPQHSPAPSPTYRDGGITSGFPIRAANTLSSHQLPSHPADGRLAPQAPAQQLPDLIELQAPEASSLLQPAPTANAGVLSGNTICTPRIEIKWDHCH